MAGWRALQPGGVFFMAMGGRTGRSTTPSSPLELRLRHPHYLISHPVRFLLKPVIGRADGELGLQPGPAQNLADLGVLRTPGGVP